MSQYKIIALFLGAFALAGCGGQTIPDPDPVEETVAPSGANTDPYGAGSNDPGEEIFYEGELPMIIYFEFDSSDLRPADSDTVARHAIRMSEDQYVSVRLEGHADERGSREYNIGLGERRAQTVRRLLMIQGVGASQISTVSFGEERPADDGSNESAYAANRRVEFRYSN